MLRPSLNLRNLVDVRPCNCLSLGDRIRRILLFGCRTYDFGMTTHEYEVTSLKACSTSLWQSTVPEDIQGRVFSVRSVVAALPMPYA